MYRILTVAIFCLAVFLRGLLCWENPPSNSFDDHFEPISLIIKNGNIPPKDACFQCYHPPVFYYTSAKIGETLNALDMKETTVRKSLQFLNFLYNILTLAVVYFILRALNLSSFSKIVAFTTVCILPRHIYMAAMHSNDNLCILLVALCCYLVLIAIDRKLAWQTVVLVGITITLAIFVKYTAFVLFPAVLISLILIPIYVSQISLSRTTTAVLFSLLPAIFLLGTYMTDNVRDYGKPLPWNDKMFNTSVIHPRDPAKISYVSFAPWQYMIEPLIIPGQMHSFWTIIYSGTWFDIEPKFTQVTDKNRIWWPQYFGWLSGVMPFPSLPSPLSISTRLLAAGLLICGIVPLLLVMAGFVWSVRFLILCKDADARIEAVKLNFFTILLVTNAAGVILLTLKAPVYSSMKATYFFNSLPAFAVLNAIGIKCIDKRRWIKIIIASVCIALVLLVIQHVFQIATAFSIIQGKY